VAGRGVSIAYSLLRAPCALLSRLSKIDPQPDFNGSFYPDQVAEQVLATVGEEVSDRFFIRQYGPIPHGENADVRVNCSQ
jgi:hypothetical protein